jgi:archaellum component FlaF (FlaF/FlaG flagellin family)
MMESVITAILMISLLVLLIFGLAQYLLASQAQISDVTREMQERLTERTRTDITTVGVEVTPAGDYVEVMLKNAGQTKLADFEYWDVILQYTDGSGGQHVQWYTFASQWNYQIYQSLAPPLAEVIEPGILNPGEYLRLQVNVSPLIGMGTTNLVTIATPNGVSATAVFTH